MLTERSIRDAKPEGKTRTVWDSKVAGLGLQVTQGGTKNFVIRYKVAGRRRQAIIARAGQLSLADARKRAGIELVKIRAGETDPLEREREARAAPTVEDAFERFLGPYSDGRIERGRMKDRTRKEYAKQARRYVLPALGKRKVASIQRADIERLVERMPGPTRNRVLALCSRLFTLCEHWGDRRQHSNPARGIERAVERARERILSTEELAALAGALEDLAGEFPVATAAIRVEAMTGLRVSEVVSMRWQAVDMDSGRVHLDDTKNGARDHDLPPAALAILAGLPRIDGNPFVFASKAGSHCQPRQAGKVFRMAAAAAGLEDARPHDLRRTVATRAAMAGLSAFALRDMLGWKTLDMPHRYARLAASTAREHRQAIGEQMAAAMAGETGKVVPLRRA